MQAPKFPLLNQSNLAHPSRTHTCFLLQSKGARGPVLHPWPCGEVHPSTCRPVFDPPPHDRCLGAVFLGGPSLGRFRLLCGLPLET